MMRIVDIFLAIPVVFLFIFVSTIVAPDPRHWLLIAVLSGLSWLVPARLVRGETLSLRTREYVQAVRVMGGKSRRIVFRHIIPNAIGTIIVNATFQVADAIMVLAVLQYLGFAPPTAHRHLGRDAVAGQQLPLRRLLVAGLPGTDHDRPHRRGVQLHRRCAARQLRSPPPGALSSAMPR